MAQGIRLANRAVIAVSGEEAQDFLQGIITNSIDKLTAGEAVYAGLLTPQGKLLFDFFITTDGERYLFDVDTSLVADLKKRLTFYKLRAKADIEILEQAVVGASWGPQAAAPAAAISYQDPRISDFAQRFMLLTPGEQELATDEDGWCAHRLAFGLPEGPSDYSYGDCFPHDIAMDQLNGIDFNKGCYVGQEVVSRMRHRGTARKRPMLLKAEAGLPAAPASVDADGVSVGEMRSVADRLGLAEIRTDRAASALEAGKAFTVGGIAVTLLRPAWADYAEMFEAADA